LDFRFLEGRNSSV